MGAPAGREDGIGPGTLNTATVAFLAAFLLTLGLDWPRLPLNARLPDLMFAVLLVAIVASGHVLRPRRHHLDTFVALYLLGGVPSLLATTDLTASLVELVRQLYLAAIYLTIAVVVAGGHVRRVLTAVALGGIGLAVAGLACLVALLVTGAVVPGAGQVMALPYVGEVLRLRAFTASEAMLACLLTVAVPYAVTLSARATAEQRRAWAAAACLGLVAALLTFAAAASGALTAATMAVWSRWRARPAWRYAAVVATIAAVLLLNLAVAVSIRSVQVGGQVLADRTSYHYGVDDGRVTLESIDIDYAVMSYARLKQLAWEAFVDRPMTGVGLDRFHDVSERAYQQGRLTADYRAIDPHATLPGRLAETGFPGGITLVLLWVAFGLTGLRLVRADGPHAWAAAATLAGLAGLVVASVNVDVMNLRVLWVAFGVVRGLGPPVASRSPAA